MPATEKALERVTSNQLSPEGLPYDTFAARLAIVRVVLGGWNVKRTAEFCGGLDDASWRNWESGGNCRDREWVCLQIHRATGISYEWLMSGGPLARNRCFTLLRSVPMLPVQDELPFWCLGGHSLADEDGQGNDPNGLWSGRYPPPETPAHGRRPVERVPSGRRTTWPHGLHHRAAGVLAADGATDLRVAAAA